MIPKTRRALTLDGAGRIAVRELPLSPPGPNELLVEVRASCISPGTELGRVPALRQSPDLARAPRPFGYSCAGMVIAGGAGCDDTRPGTRVACMGAGYAQHATHAVAPRNLCVEIPAETSFEAAATCHLAATGMHAVRRGGFGLSEHVAVFGLGIVGYFTAQLAALAGAHVLGVDPLPLRREQTLLPGLVELCLDPADPAFATHAGELDRGHGFDGGVIAFGGEASAAFRQAVSLLVESPDGHRMGRIVVVGGARIDHAYAAALGNVDVRSSARTGPGYHDAAWEHGQEYPDAFVRWSTRRNLEECLRLMASGRLAAEAAVTHRVPLEEGPALCDLLVEHPEAALGVLLLPG